MSRKPDDWEAKRTPLTAEEIAVLRSQYLAGASYYVAAALVRCSSRIASKYYAEFRGQPNVRERLRDRRREPRTGAKNSATPAAKGEIVLPVGGSEFIRPLTRAELMRGRA